MLKVARKQASSQTGRHLRRSKYIKNTAYIGPVRPASASSDSDSSTPSGRMLSIDQFYDSMQKYRDEYKRFNAREQQLESEIEAFENDQEHFYEHLLAFVEAFNEAMDSAADFDKVFETNHVDVIGAYIRGFIVELEDIGLYVEPDFKLYLNKYQLRKALNDTPDRLAFIGQDLLPGLYKLFHDLKPLPPNTSAIDEGENAHGRFIDLKG